MWVGWLTSCKRLESNTRSQNWFEGPVDPESVDQFISGRLKSPIIMSGVVSTVRVYKRASEFCVYSELAFGGLYRRQILIGLAKLICTNMNSKLVSEGRHKFEID